MSEESNYEERVERLIRNWDEQIERFKEAAKEAGPEVVKKYREAIDLLVANREATRRGLLQIDEGRPDLCLTCPGRAGREGEETPAKEGPLERAFQEDVMRSPRHRYGPEER